MANKIGLIMAVRTDQRDNHFIVLQLIHDEIEVSCFGVRTVDIPAIIASHKKQTISQGVPVYRHVWFQPIEIPRG